jgi:DNA-binding MarR family transcriptional regulator
MVGGRYGVPVTEWLDDEEMAAWRGLVDVSAAVMGALESELVAHHGITTGDYGVLARLSEAENSSMRMCDLASALHLSPSGLTRRLDGLVRRQLVSREPSAGDRRVMLAVLTDEGRAFLERIAPLHLDGVRRYFISQLSRTQLRNLSSAFRSIERGFVPTESDD